jgi:4-hydroxy-2-oxoheptanedioate aldolase
MGLRELWDQHGATLGGWCSIPSAFSAELMGRSGFDWVCVDTQHGLIGYDQMTLMLQGLAITRTPAFVRVPWNAPDHIMKALDAGAEGIIVPMVSSAADAAAAVAASRYPPDGTRSWGPVRAALDVPGYSPQAGNRRTVLAVMIETPGGVENVDEILAVPGVDAVYIGPADLALSHGMAPALDVTDPVHRGLIETVLAACKRHQVTAGIHCDRADTVRRWWDAGFEMCTLASDATLMRAAAAAAVSAVASHPRRAARPAQGPSASSAATYA